MHTYTHLFPTRLIEQSCPFSTPFISGTSDLDRITPGSIKSAPPCSLVNTYGPVDAEGSISGHFHSVYTATENYCKLLLFTCNDQAD